MSTIIISVYRNTNMESKAYNKFYGRVRHTSTIDVTTVCKHAAMDSGIEESQVVLINDAQQKQMKELLCNGHPIEVPELGTFKLGVSSVGLSVEDVKRRYPKFNPETDDIRLYLTANQVKEAHILFTPSDTIKNALRSIKMVTDKSDWQAPESANDDDNNHVEP